MIVEHLSEDFDQWALAMNTHSRADVIKVCAILANVFQLDAKDSIFIYIAGCFLSGKSLIVDAITAHLSDDHQAYHLSEDPLVELIQGRARYSALQRQFQIKGRPRNITLCHLHHTPKELKGGNAIHFETWINQEDHEQSGISILFNDDDDCTEGDWGRSWVIAINDPNQQTPQMAEALEHLRHFHARRFQRLECPSY